MWHISSAAAPTDEQLFLLLVEMERRLDVKDPESAIFFTATGPDGESGQCGDRRQVADLVCSGAITPAHAEEIAFRNGWARFENTPEISEFHPLELREWTLPMAIAWIASRKPEAVTKQWNKYRSEYLRFKSGQLDGPESMPDATIIELTEWGDSEKPDGEYAQISQSSWDDLRSSLQAGEIEAEGINHSDGRPEVVPRLAWRVLEPRDHERSEILQGGGYAYRDIVVQTKKIQELWPAVANTPSLAETPSAVQPDECDAAQDRGEVQKARGSNVPERNSAPTVTDLGLSAKIVHEARQFRDAEANRLDRSPRAAEKRLAEMVAEFNDGVPHTYDSVSEELAANFCIPRDETRTMAKGKFSQRGRPRRRNNSATK